MEGTRARWSCGWIAAAVCGLAGAGFWGGGAVVTRHLASSFAMHDLVLLRYLGAFPLAAAALLVAPHRLGLHLPWRRLALLLALAGPPYQALLIAGYDELGAGQGSLLVTGLLAVFSLALPVLTVSAGPPAAPVAWFGAIACGGGLVAYAAAAPTGLEVTPLGAALFALAAAMWAAFNGLVRSWALDPMRLTIALAIWSPLFLPAWWLMGGQASIAQAGGERWVADAALQMLYQGVLVSIVATALFLHAVRRLGPAAAGLLQATTPGFAAVLGVSQLNEQLSSSQWIALGVGMAGIALALAGRNFAVVRKPRARAGPEVYAGMRR